LNKGDLNQDEILTGAVSEIGIDTDWFFQRVREQDIKDKLRDESAEAVKRGAFGGPTFYGGKKMFWGNDRLIFVEECLKGNL
jgi:2-hydroxychromene-2-carboxylate isomerase